ncbi:MAG: RNA polymerase sporulation sigma factor SigG [Clostridia bacterium]|nr:RNA polymerase sporulation sigma factor SigG [Clostridia bacterium]
MYTGKVDICGIDTSKLPRLKDKETNELLKKARAGDNNARNELINGNLRLVLSVVKRFWGRGENPDDLFQVGCIGLIKAIDNFDLSLNVCFSTYGCPMIIGEIRRYLRDNNSIKISRSIKDTAYKAMQAKEKLIIKTKREPTVSEIAEEMGIPREDVVVALESIVDPISLYEPVFSENGDSVYVLDQIGDKNDDSNWLCEISMRDAISRLSSRERNILSLRFIKGKTQMEVSNEIGISQAQVSRLEKNAIDKIKN